MAKHLCSCDFHIYLCQLQEKFIVNSKNFRYEQSSIN
jgi:hypothetical protein